MPIEFLQLLFLIITANGAPVLVRLLLKDHLDLAIDFGAKFVDGNRIFGSSKTWRGIIAALLATSIAAFLLEHSLETGFQIAVFAIFGDLLSSFIKRRLGMKSSSKAFLLDQVPESLLPAVMMKHSFALAPVDILFLVFIFVVIDLVMTYILYHWRILKNKS
ncbi:CDP-archaeol synthase [Nitrosomonas sp.]|uniref:CDP-archaeol synthase n=1 Tax=Nitrosomonas sp. TaxID=42353 RepID=UPI001D37D95B|nr:CDP-archaeol synthase [Nitrosomonas sp.]MBX3616495.1 CDP-archaeol synthase [Nitrosomonas sp.]